MGKPAPVAAPPNPALAGRAREVVRLDAAIRALASENPDMWLARYALNAWVALQHSALWTALPTAGQDVVLEPLYDTFAAAFNTANSLAAHPVKIKLIGFESSSLATQNMDAAVELFSARLSAGIENVKTHAWGLALPVLAVLALYILAKRA